MSDKDKVIADILVSAIRSGFKVTIEHNNIGAVKQGNHFHVAYIDELLEEMKDVDPWDYINKQLANGQN